MRPPRNRQRRRAHASQDPAVSKVKVVVRRRPELTPHAVRGNSPIVHEAAQAMPIQKGDGAGGEGEVYGWELLPSDWMKRKFRPSSKRIVEQFLAVKGKKRRELVNWKSVLDEEYTAPNP